MNKHKGMRPHDIAVLLKIVAKHGQSWKMKDLAFELGISGGEISESLQRSAYAGLIVNNKKQVMKQNLIDFIQYGLQFVFPIQPGGSTRGLPTAYSAFPISSFISSNASMVWPYSEGTVKGTAIEPLYPGAVKACILDANFYELMSLVDTMRIGKNREKSIAVDELKKRMFL
jgi:hypothetical protein